MAFELPDLPYAHDALEPHIDAKTMEIHHGKHHNAYTTNLNNAIEGTDLASSSIEDILGGISGHSAAIRNNGGGFYNHCLFWEVMGADAGGAPDGDLADAINKAFGSFEEFQTQFATAAATRFGSGWAWLVATGDGLVITSTPNQDNPLMDDAEVKGTPVLGLDVWEHAYYLNYQNRRPDYVTAFWNVVNWSAVAEKYAAAV